MELVTCRVPEDPTSPAPAGGYVMPCMTFYKRGFGVPSHRFSPLPIVVLWPGAASLLRGFYI
jgi:hypothetical protein